MTNSTPQLPPAIDTALAQVPVPMVVLHLPAGSYVTSNPAWDGLFGAGTIDEIVPADDMEEVRTLLRAVADHHLEGYFRRGQFVTADGHAISAQLSLQRLELPDISDLGITVIVPADQERVGPPLWTSFVGDVADLAVVVTDHNWQIEHASRDAEESLGYTSGTTIGTALLGLVHPHDALKLLQAIEGTVASKHATIARVRMRAGDAPWWDAVCIITTICEHDPPRLAVLLSNPGSVPATPSSARGNELEQHLWRIALEVRAAGLLPDVGNALPALPTLESTELSGRQWEIVTRLVRGQRVPAIARAMYLSQSTVRNHLTAVYRKFGVHSQQELVSLLTRVAGSPG